MSEILNAFLLNKVEIPLVSVTAAIEDAGYLVDVDHFKRLQKDIEAKLKDSTRDFRKALGKVIGKTKASMFNPESHPQVRALLYDTMKLPVSKRTKNGAPSTDDETLSLLADTIPIAGLLITLRKLTKFKSTYCDGILEAVGSDGRLHPDFNQLGADTGRFTANGIIQTMPKVRNDEFGIRKGFRAPPGCQIVAGDFSQQELRILAQVSGDPAMQQAIKDGVDLHGLAAVKVYKLACEPNDVETKHPEYRDGIKAVQFGLIYGKSPKSLASDLKITIDEAKQLLDDYFAEFPKVKEFTEDVHKQLQRDGYVDDLFGRRRYFLHCKAKAKTQRQRFKNAPPNRDTIRRLNMAKRAAQNFAIQGPAATITKLAMLACYKHITKEHPDIRMILTLHDEIQFEVPDALVDHFATELPELMCDLGLAKFRFTTPMKVAVKVGPTWADLKPWKGPADAK